MISRRRGNRTPDHRARYRPNPWTESGIARRNRNQSTPALTMTRTADHNHTTKPQNTNNPNTPPSSTIAKRTTQNTRTTDQTGKRKPKTDPVRACADHGITPATRPTPQTRRIPTIRARYNHQPSPNQPLRTPESRTKPENIGQNQNQSTPMPDHVRPPTTASSQKHGITGI